MIDELMKELKEESNPIIATINNILKEHTQDLDNLIDRVSNTITRVREQELKEYPTRELELDFTQLTTEIYKLNKVMAEMGGYSDIAKNKREVAFSKAYLEAKGNTIKEKEALAQLEIKEEDIVEKVYDRVLRQLRLTLETADSVHAALKRMHSAKLTELEVFRGEELRRD